MNPETFEQYQKALAEIQKLFTLAGTNMLDVITSQLTDSQFEQIRNHPASDVLDI